jgi:predicted NUDIX family phosphoesterase
VEDWTQSFNLELDEQDLRSLSDLGLWNPGNLEVRGVFLQWFPRKLKHKAQRIKYKDGIAFGDEYVNWFKKSEQNSSRIHPHRGFLLYSLCFVLYALTLTLPTELYDS